MEIGSRQVRSVVVEAVITRADGTVEPQGVVAEFHADGAEPQEPGPQGVVAALRSMFRKD